MAQVLVRLTVVCEADGDAARVVEVLSRAALGLALEGMAACVDVLPEAAESESEAEEAETGD